MEISYQPLILQPDTNKPHEYNKSTILEQLNQFTPSGYFTDSITNSITIDQTNGKLLRNIYSQLKQIYDNPTEKVMGELLNLDNQPQKIRGQDNQSFDFKFNQMNDTQKLARWYSILSNVNLDNIADGGLIPIKLDITMYPYRWVGLESDINNNLYKCENIAVERFTIEKGETNDAFNKRITEYINGYISYSKISTQKVFIIPIEISNGTHTEPYIFKVENGTITEVLHSNSGFIHDAVRGYMDACAQDKKYAVFHVKHDGSCTKLSNYVLKMFDAKVKEAKSNNNINHQDLLNNVFGSYKNNQPNNINIQKALLLSYFGIDITQSFGNDNEPIITKYCSDVNQVNTSSKIGQQLSSYTQDSPITLSKVKDIPLDSPQNISSIDAYSNIFITACNSQRKNVGELNIKTFTALDKIDTFLTSEHYVAGDIEKLSWRTKLAHLPIYSIRHNKAGRLFFVILEYCDNDNQKQQKAVLIGYTENHNYAKVEQNVKEYNVNQDIQSLQSYYEQQPEVKIQQLKVSLAPDEKVKNNSYVINNQIITIDNKEQIRAINIKAYPAIVAGSAGSGKTTVAIAMIINQINGDGNEIPKILYVTQSDTLAKNVSDTIFEQFREDPRIHEIKQNVQILSYNNLIKQCCDKTIADFKTFSTYLESNFNGHANKTYKKGKQKNSKQVTDNSSSIASDPQKLYNEFKLIATIKANSNNDKESQKTYYACNSIYSAYATSDEKKDIWGMYDAYQQYLIRYSQIDPALMIVNLPKKKYDLIIADESQDFNGVQINNITQLCKLTNKALNICILYSAHQSLSLQIPYPNEVFNQITQSAMTVINFDVCFRNPLKIIKLNQFLLYLQNKILQGQLTTFCSSMPDHDTRSPVDGRIYVIPENGNLLNKYIKQPSTVLLVWNEDDKKSAQQKYTGVLIYTIAEFKGLESENIVLDAGILKQFNTLYSQNKDWGEIAKDLVATLNPPGNVDYKLNKVKDRGSITEEEISLKHIINMLYVAISRATHNLIIIDDVDGKKNKKNILSEVKQINNLIEDKLPEIQKEQHQLEQIAQDDNSQTREERLIDTIRHDFNLLKATKHTDLYNVQILFARITDAIAESDKFNGTPEVIYAILADYFISLDDAILEKINKKDLFKLHTTPNIPSDAILIHHLNTEQVEITSYVGYVYVLCLAICANKKLSWKLVCKKVLMHLLEPQDTNKTKEIVKRYQQLQTFFSGMPTGDKSSYADCALNAAFFTTGNQQSIFDTGDRRGNALIFRLDLYELSCYTGGVTYNQSERSIQQCGYGELCDINSGATQRGVFANHKLIFGITCNAYEDNKQISYEICFLYQDHQNEQKCPMITIKFRRNNDKISIECRYKENNQSITQKINVKKDQLYNWVSANTNLLFLDFFAKLDQKMTFGFINDGTVKSSDLPSQSIFTSVKNDNEFLSGLFKAAATPEDQEKFLLGEMCKYDDDYFSVILTLLHTIYHPNILSKLANKLLIIAEHTTQIATNRAFALYARAIMLNDIGCIHPATQLIYRAFRRTANIKYAIACHDVITTSINKDWVNGYIQMQEASMEILSKTGSVGLKKGIFTCLAKSIPNTITLAKSIPNTITSLMLNDGEARYEDVDNNTIKIIFNIFKINLLYNKSYDIKYLGLIQQNITTIRNQFNSDANIAKNTFLVELMLSFYDVFFKAHSPIQYKIGTMDKEPGIKDFSAGDHVIIHEAGAFALFKVTSEKYYGELNRTEEDFREDKTKSDGIYCINKKYFLVTNGTINENFQLMNNTKRPEWQANTFINESKIETFFAYYEPSIEKKPAEDNGTFSVSVHSLKINRDPAITIENAVQQYFARPKDELRKRFYIKDIEQANQDAINNLNNYMRTCIDELLATLKEPNKQLYDKWQTYKSSVLDCSFTVSPTYHSQIGYLLGI